MHDDKQGDMFDRIARLRGEGDKVAHRPTGKATAIIERTSVIVVCQCSCGDDDCYVSGSLPFEQMFTCGEGIACERVSWQG